MNNKLQEAINKANKITEAFPVSYEDDILKGFTYQELIDTVVANEPIRNEQTFNKVFNELVKIALDDAKLKLKKEMQNLIKEANRS